ncbi:MAG: C1 family peptidase [Candidatus Izimaplasma sp.]|nr:C1 family peptidase [Candidatus Izimaplasma bacterium]
MKNIELKNLISWNKELENDPQHKTLRRALVENDFNKIAIKQERAIDNTFRFSKEIDTLPVTSQEKTGRCWIFAGLNFIRERIAKKYNLKEFEYSQNYIAFYDKLEKINYFIESIDDFLTCDKDDRTLQHILNTGIQDGGQWDMFVSLVEKYGLVPKDAMIETKVSSNTRYINSVINQKLRQYTAKARQFGKGDKLNKLKSETIKALYRLLVASFGLPPKSFSFEYVDKDKNYNLIEDITPQKFYKEFLENDLSDYVSVINSPTDDKPFYKSYTIAYLGNVVDGNPIRHLNLEMSEVKELILKQMNDEVVWFGCDVASYGDRDSGVWDDQRYDYDEVFNLDLDLSKADMLDYSHSQMNHAMVLTGVSIKNDKPTKWKIQNSWGDKSGKKGYYLASDSWFDKFVYQAVINKKYLSDKQLKAYEKEPIVLNPWDPMGSLA